MINNWQLKNGATSSGLVTRRLYFKKNDIKWPFFPPCTNWPICGDRPNKYKEIIIRIMKIDNQRLKLWRTEQKCGQKKESKKLGAKTWAHGNASGPQIKSLECNLSWRHRGKNLLFSWEKFFLSVSLFFSHKTWIYDFISNHPWGHLLTVDSHCFFAFSCHLMYYTMSNIILSKILSPHTHLQ